MTFLEAYLAENAKITIEGFIAARELDEMETEATENEGGSNDGRN